MIFEQALPSILFMKNHAKYAKGINLISLIITYYICTIYYIFVPIFSLALPALPFLSPDLVLRQSLHTYPHSFKPQSLHHFHHQ